MIYVILKRRRFSVLQAYSLIVAGFAWTLPAPLIYRWYAFTGWFMAAVLFWRVENEDIYADERKTKRND